MVMYVRQEIIHEQYNKVQVIIKIEMYSQLKYSYKKSRQQFMQQLQQIRHQLHQKIKQIDTTPTLEPDKTNDRVMAMLRRKQNYSTFENKLRMSNVRREGKEDTRKNRYGVKGMLEGADWNPEVEVYRNQRAYRSGIVDSASERKFKSRAKVNLMPRSEGRQQSLPSKSQNSISTTAVSPHNEQEVGWSFQPFFLNLSINRQKRTNPQLHSALVHLQEHNKFFKKLDHYTSLCLLKIGYYHQLNTGDILYGINYDKSSFYIILSGCICLLNPNIGIKKLFIVGQTIGQEMLFSRAATKYHLELARAMTKTYALEIRVSDYEGMGEQLRKLGYRKEMEELEGGIRDSHTEKNIMRNQHILKRKLRMRTQH